MEPLSNIGVPAAGTAHAGRCRRPPLPLWEEGLCRLRASSWARCRDGAIASSDCKTGAGMLNAQFPGRYRAGMRPLGAACPGGSGLVQRARHYDFDDFDDRAQPGLLFAGGALRVGRSAAPDLRRAALTMAVFRRSCPGACPAAVRCNHKGPVLRVQQEDCLLGMALDRTPPGKASA